MTSVMFKNDSLEKKSAFSSLKQSRPAKAIKANLRIRFAEFEEIPCLNALIARAARKLNSEHYSEQQVESILNYIYGVDSQLIADRSYFIAELGGKIVGCGGWSMRNALYGGDQAKVVSADPLIIPGKGPAKIRAFFVDPDYARQGIGSTIMRACIHAAECAGYRELSLVATLTGAPLYHAFGFVARKQVAVKLPDDIIVSCIEMRKKLF